MNIESIVKVSMEQEKLENELSHKQCELEYLYEEKIKENEELQQKINEAIEYIEELNKIIPRYWFTKLLEILKGE